MGSHGTDLQCHGPNFSAMPSNGTHLLGNSSLFLGNGQPWHTFARPCLKFLCNAQLRHTFARPCLLFLGNGQPWHTFYQERSGKGTPLPGLGAAMASRWHNLTSKAMDSQGMPMTNFPGRGAVLPSRSLKIRLPMNGAATGLCRGKPLGTNTGSVGLPFYFTLLDTLLLFWILCFILGVHLCVLFVRLVKFVLRVARYFCAQRKVRVPPCKVEPPGLEGEKFFLC